MVVCLCKGVTDGKIRWLVQNGAGTIRDVMRTTQAGSDCGSCVCHVRQIIEQTKQEACDAQDAACCRAVDLASND